MVIAEPKDLTVIIPCKNEKKYLHSTLKSILDAEHGQLLEIIVVDDGSTDGCCAGLTDMFPQVKLLKTPGIGVSYARNLGAKGAQGKIFVFCDANIQVEKDLFIKLLAGFENPDVKVQAPYLSDIQNPATGGFGMTLNNHLDGVWLGQVHKLTEVPVLPSTCLAVYADVYWQVGGFDEGFRILGHEDVELSIRLWLCGYSLWLNPFTRIKHIFRSEKPYYFQRKHWVYNVIRLSCLHFNTKRIAKTLNLFKNHDYFIPLVSEIMTSDVWEVRKKLEALRKHDDDWYMSRFGIPF
ncbi:MAG: glycosyltransferase family 2 protein [Zhaonellaceae bacterium]|jgi:glycosyltransferase involved in cell wall biosynthesis|nr:glycosyltransferase [Clostridia bacterium]